MEKREYPCIDCPLFEGCRASGNDAAEACRRIEHELKVSLHRFKRLCDATFEGIVLHENGVFIESNQQFADMFGYALEEIEGLNGFDLFAPQSRQFAADKVTSGYEGAYQVIGLKKDGTQFPVEIRAKKCRLDGRDVRIGVCRDMSALEQAGNHLLLKEGELEAVFESSSDCILVWDKDCNYLYANQASINHVKTTRDKVIGKNIRDGLGHLPEFMNLWKHRVECVFATGKPARFTDEMPIGDKFVYSESILSPIRHPDGSMFAVSVVYRDVSEQKLAEAEIKASQERFRRLSETAFEAILIHRDGDLVDANQKFFEMFGYTKEELGGINGADLIAPQFRHMVRGNMEASYAPIYEAVGLRKDGTEFPIEIQAKNSRMDGVAVRITAIKDLTRRKEMQRQLIESERKFRTLYEHAQVALYRTRISDGKLIECNLAMATLLGYDSKEECLREHYSAAHYVDPSQRVQLLARLEKEGSVANFEIEFIRRNGTHGWVDVTATLYPQEGTIEGVQFDITAAKVLSPAEKKVLALIMRGYSNKEVGKRLGRSIRTVEDQRAKIMQKLGASNQVELAKLVCLMHPLVEE